MNSLSNKLFENHFSEVYGARWPLLKQALLTPEKQILRPNLFLESRDHIDAKPCSFLPGCYWKPDGFKLEKNASGLYSYYVMDPASLIVARALEAKPGEQILDMCAAPGGKTLALAESLAEDSQEDSILVSNEYSESRRERLTRVLHEYISKEKRMFIHAKGLDGNQYGLRQPEVFDRVLADVPCSGERHLLENATELAEWSPKRTKNLAVRQYSLLSSAWLTVKKQGRIVYSTCSISPTENDEVVAKLIKKRKPNILRPSFLDAFECLEKTEHGYQVLPDRSEFGPMYFSVIEKI